MIEIEIGGHTFTVTLESGRAMKDLYGDSSYQTRKIRLLKSMDVELRRATLAHEIFHIFLGSSGYKEILESVNENLEEALTVAFENNLGHLMHFPEELESWIRGES